MAQPLASRSAAVEGILSRPGRLIIGIAVLAALLLVLPGRTVATRGLDELFYILDGANRVLSGQVPGRDFITGRLSPQ